MQIMIECFAEKNRISSVFGNPRINLPAFDAFVFMNSPLWVIFYVMPQVHLSSFLLAASSCNMYTKTFTGIDGAGKRLADEVSLGMTSLHTSCL